MTIDCTRISIHSYYTHSANEIFWNVYGMIFCSIQMYWNNIDNIQIHILKETMNKYRKKIYLTWNTRYFTIATFITWMCTYTVDTCIFKLTVTILKVLKKKKNTY